ncbi:cytochrome c3 family protein [Variovorax sp. dw_954]|uniref:cytochrome c3 family protein n=1 Tax=Variovorax sp. dw_954 TaxID=2720078 RepID=UPI001BD57F54|nr:cytochrome c3 family protein [Variovorax sp. dw_954]
MAQVVGQRAELAVKLGLLAVLACTAFALVLLLWRGQEDTTRNEVVTQPIPFSHKHHVGDVGLDCRFCHAQVERSASPGFPSTQVCLGCHSQLFAGQAMFEPLRESARTGAPVAWKRVHRLPDFVYFDHSIHVAKGVACIDCHGRVDQMPLMRRVSSLRMDWCIDCHRNPQPHLRDPSHVFDMRPLGADDMASVQMLSRLQSQQRLTDCSTCHR